MLQWPEIHPLTFEGQWLMTEATTDQLQEIADFLNDHMQRIRDQNPDLNGLDPENSNTSSTWYAIDETASGIALDVIGFLMNNPNASFEFSPEYVNLIGNINNTIPNNYPSTQNNYPKAIRDLSNFLRLYGEEEHEIVADYFESLIDDFESMTMGEVHDIYINLKHIADEIPKLYFNAIANVYFSDLVMPVLTNAILNGSANLVTKLLQRIPIGNVMLGERLNRWVQHISQLGVQGNQTHVRIVSTSQPVANAQSIFNTLTRNAISTSTNSSGTIVANMGNGNFITFRTVSSTNFPATIDFNFPLIFGQNVTKVIKFTAL